MRRFGTQSPRQAVNFEIRLRLPPAFILASGDLLTIKALLAPSTAPAVPASPAVSPA